MVSLDEHMSILPLDLLLNTWRLWEFAHEIIHTLSNVRTKAVKKVRAKADQKKLRETISTMTSSHSSNMELSWKAQWSGLSKCPALISRKEDNKTNSKRAKSTFFLMLCNVLKLNIAIILRDGSKIVTWGEAQWSGLPKCPTFVSRKEDNK